MLQGLGKSLINFIATKLRGWKIQTAVNESVRTLNTRSSYPLMTLKYLPEGITALDLQDASEIPGILIQIAVVLGNQPPGYRFPKGNHVGLSKGKLRKIQRCIYLFLRLCRCHRKRKSTDRDVEVFQATLREFLLNFRDCFQDVSKSRCKFPKFHSVLHFALQITEFGSTFFTDTNT